MASVGTYYVTIMPDMSGFSTKILKEIDAAAASTEGGKRAGTNFMSGFAGAAQVALGNVMSNIATQAWGALSQGIAGGVERLDTMSVFPKIMANMGIDEASAKKAADRVAKSIQGLPTALDDAIRSVQRLTMSTGDVDKATDVFIAFNNALIAGGAPMSLQASALEQFSQAVNKGKPDMLEWRSLMNAMPAQLRQIASAMGMTTDELGEGLRKGDIAMDDFLDALVRVNKEGVDGYAAFSEQVTTMTDTVGVALANARNRAEKFWQAIFEGIGQERISGLINGITEKLPEYGAAIGGFIDDVISKFEELDGIQAFNDLKESWNDLKSTVSGIWDDVKPEFEELLSTIFATDVELSWESFKEFLAGAFKQTLIEIKSLLDGMNAAAQGLKDYYDYLNGKGGYDFTDSTRYTNTNMYGAGGTIRGWENDANLQQRKGGIYWYYNDPAAQLQATDDFYRHILEKDTETTNSIDQNWQGLNSNLNIGWEVSGSRWGNTMGHITLSSGKMRDSVKGDFDSVKLASDTAGNSIASSISSGMDNALKSVNGKVASINSSIKSIKGKTVDIALNVYKTGISGIDFKTSVKNGAITSIQAYPFATGGIVTGPTWSLMGEAGTEAIVPLDNPRYVGTFADAIADKLNGRDSGNVNNYYIDGNLVASDAILARALDTVAERVSGRRRMGAIA